MRTTHSTFRLAGHAVHQQAKQVPFVVSQKAKKSVLPLGDVVVGEQRRLAACLWQMVKGGEGNVNQIAHPSNIDDSLMRHGFDELATEKRNHGSHEGGGRETVQGV